MATYQETLFIDSKYTAPDLVAYQLYKGGMFEGYGDISYCLLKIGLLEVGKYKFFKENFEKNRNLIDNFISFIGHSEFDSITREELAFIESTEYDYLSQYLANTHITFDIDFSVSNFQRSRDSFTEDDEGKAWMDLNVNLRDRDIVQILDYDYKINREEAIYIGNFSIKKDDRHIKIPIIRLKMEEREGFLKINTIGHVEILKINTNVNLYKCVGFIGKLNALYYFLHENRYSDYVFWKGNFIASNYNLERKLSYFNYYKILP